MATQETSQRGTNMPTQPQTFEEMVVRIQQHPRDEYTVGGPDTPVHCISRGRYVELTAKAQQYTELKQQFEQISAELQRICDQSGKEKEAAVRVRAALRLHTDDLQRQLQEQRQIAAQLLAENQQLQTQKHQLERSGRPCQDQALTGRFAGVRGKLRAFAGDFPVYKRGFAAGIIVTAGVAAAIFWQCSGY